MVFREFNALPYWIVLYIFLRKDEEVVNQLSHALADVGLVTLESVEKQSARQAEQGRRKAQRDQRERYLASDEGRPESFSSASEFMNYARRRLKDERYSESLMDEIFHEAHKFADAKLVRKQRDRMHLFLCQLKEMLEGTPVEQRQRILRDGKRAFQQMNAKNL